MPFPLTTLKKKKTHNINRDALPNIENIRDYNKKTTGTTVAAMGNKYSQSFTACLT